MGARGAAWTRGSRCGGGGGSSLDGFGAAQIRKNQAHALIEQSLRCAHLFVSLALNNADMPLTKHTRNTPLQPAHDHIAKAKSASSILDSRAGGGSGGRMAGLAQPAGAAGLKGLQDTVGGGDDTILVR